LFVINSEELFEVVVTDLITGIAVMHHFVVHPLQDPCCFLNNFTRYKVLFCLHRGIINETVEVTPKEKVPERLSV
jgi:hypothetical protein